MKSGVEVQLKVLGSTGPDPTAVLLGTGYVRFSSQTGIDGLAKLVGHTLEILAVHARKQGTGQFRNFITQAKEEYLTIKLWHVWNPFLEAALDRYGFRLVKERVVFVDASSEVIEGWRWDR